jgi:hypothetical protein
MYNPNWLLSAMAQSTAAIVAIIGGFILTRVISSFMEKKSKQSSIAEVDNRIQEFERLIFREEQSIRSSNVEFFRRAIELRIDSPGYLPDIDEMIRDIEYTYQRDIVDTVFEEDFVIAYRLIYAEHQEAKEKIDNLIEDYLSLGDCKKVYGEFCSLHWRKLKGFNQRFLSIFFENGIGSDTSFGIGSIAESPTSLRDWRLEKTILNMKDDIFLFCNLTLEILLQLHNRPVGSGTNKGGARSSYLSGVGVCRGQRWDHDRHGRRGRIRDSSCRVHHQGQLQ